MKIEKSDEYLAQTVIKQGMTIDALSLVVRNFMSPELKVALQKHTEMAIETMEAGVGEGWIDFTDFREWTEMMIE
ncbi:MAG: hypothetical protein DHS20C12_11760 [Pseudohongiella sp.]|nr:MAG: hypothetical protein DHS20C12_11760 [Pseudohongiella sp.]